MDLNLDHKIKTTVVKKAKSKLSTLLAKHPEYLTQKNSKDLLILAIRTKDTDMIKFTISLLPNIFDLNLVYVIWDIMNAEEQNLVELLLQSNINVNSASKTNTTILHFAVKLQAFNTIRKLLELGANVHAKNDWGKTPLHEAANIGSTEIMSLLLDYGANPRVSDYANRNMLHYLCRSTEYINPEIIESILDKNIPINQTDIYTNTALHMAISMNKVRITKLLIERGADIHAENETGNTPLNIAIIYENHTIINILLRNHAKLNKPNSHGHLPIHLAYNSKSETTTKILLEANANLYEEGNLKTPFFFLCDQMNQSISIIIREMIKRIEAKMFVSLLDIELLKYSEQTKNYFREVETEIKTLKNTYLFENPHNKSLANILVASNEENAILFQHKPYRKEFEKICTVNDYPIFFNDLEEKYLQAYDFRLQVKEKEIIITNILFQFFPPSVISKIAFETVSLERKNAS